MVRKMLYDMYSYLCDKPYQAHIDHSVVMIYNSRTEIMCLVQEICGG